MKYKRVLLKISGEQLAGNQGHGIDHDAINLLKDEIKKATDSGVQVVLVCGGGNWVRGADYADTHVKPTSAHYMGMLSGMINALAIADIFNKNGLRTRSLSNVFAPQVLESFSSQKAEEYLEGGEVVLMAGGTGRPFFSHDTAAVNMALILDCDVVLKGTKVDGIYTKDPMKFSDATKLEDVTYEEAIRNPEIKIMDKAAIALAMEQKMPIIVFDLYEKDNFQKLLQGEQIGTNIKDK